MITLKETLKKFDEKFDIIENEWEDDYVGDGDDEICVANPPNPSEIKDFISQEIKTALESMEVKEGDYTWKRTEQEPIDNETTFWEGYNTCREIVKKNIENYLKN